MAGAELVSQGPGSLFYVYDRMALGEEAHPGDVSQCQRDGEGGIWHRGGLPLLFRQTCQNAYPRGGVPDSRLSAQSESVYDQALVRSCGEAYPMDIITDGAFAGRSGYTKTYDGGSGCEVIAATALMAVSRR